MGKPFFISKKINITCGVIDKFYLMGMRGISGAIVLLLVIFIAGCSSLAGKKDPYAKAWSQVVGSPALNESLTRNVTKSIEKRPEFFVLP